MCEVVRRCVRDHSCCRSHRQVDMSESLPPCEFRTLDRSDVYRCNAAEGASLGPREGELVQRICGSCSVPGVLASERSCLHLVAWAEVDGERSEGQFACRFFHPSTTPPGMTSTSAPPVPTGSRARRSSCCPTTPSGSRG